MGIFNMIIKKKAIFLTKTYKLFSLFNSVGINHCKVFLF